MKKAVRRPEIVAISVLVRNKTMINAAMKRMVLLHFLRRARKSGNH